MRQSLLFSPRASSLENELIRGTWTSSKLALIIALAAVLFSPGAHAERWGELFKGMARELINEGMQATREGNDRSIPITQQQQPRKPDQRTGTRPTRPYSQDQIRDIQTQLQRLGYHPGSADGIFGNNTSKAIAQFEIDQRLPVTGKPSQALTAALHRASTQSMHDNIVNNGARTGQELGQSTQPRPRSPRSVPDTSKDPMVQALQQCVDSHTKCRRQPKSTPQVCSQQFNICLKSNASVSGVQASTDERDTAQKKPKPPKPAPQKTYKLPDPDPIEDVRATAIAAVFALNTGKSEKVPSMPGEVPKIDQRQLQLGASATSPKMVTIARPADLLWANIGNELNQATTTLRQVSERNKALRRHARKLHKALEICCSCTYRDKILDEFVKWQAEALWNTQVTQNAMGALQGNVDFGRLIPSREQDRQKLIAMAPPPCEQPTEIPEPKVVANDKGISINRKVDWGVVPDNFQLPTPPQEQTRGDLLYTAHVQLPGRLSGVAIDSFNRHRLPGYDDLTRLEQEIYGKDVHFFSNTPVLHCYYLRSDYQGFKVIRYWYRKRPERFDADYLRTRLKNHPILHIRAPNNQCPQDIDTAEAMPY